LKHYGLIGYPLSHSFSETYFHEKFEREQILATYQNFAIPTLDELHNLVVTHSLNGFNVTIPHKQKIIPLLDSIDPIAAQIGAVNCVCVCNGKLVGFNTDYIGFEESLLPLVKLPIKAMVFGTGGASQAITYVLQKHQIPFLRVSRNEIEHGITYADLNEQYLNDYHLLINCTPVGMYPMMDEVLPIPYQWINAFHVAYDLIYNPAKTPFLQFCEAKGATIQNGLHMLEIQAEEAYKLFTA
jgi:shikimate dehydrogenase